MRSLSTMILGDQENISMLDKSAKTQRVMRSLPPNVHSVSRGFVDVVLDKVQWNVSDYPGVTARVLWWGESIDQAGIISLNASSRNSLNYNVCTNPTLFHKYLSGCEAIEISFSSTVTGKGPGRQIGTAFVSIPETLLRNDDECKFATHTSTHKIYSARNTCLGLAKVTLKMVIFDDLTKPSDPLSQKNSAQRFTQSRTSSKDYSIYKKDLFSGPRPDSRLSNYSSSTSKVWTFLKGREMSPRDEASTLRDLTESSPANSVIEALDEELTWKLRNFQSRLQEKNERISRGHNPGSAEKDSGGSSASGGGGGPPEKDRKKGGGKNNAKSNGNAENNSNSSVQNSDPKALQRPTKESPETDEEEYQGVFYVGGFRNQHPQTRVPNVFAIAKSVSNVDNAILKTNLSDTNLFINYLKLFPIRIDTDHLDAAMKQKSMSVELWTRTGGGGGKEEKKDVRLGTATVGLHPFFVAFRSDVVRQRLFDLPMPVVALDGWAMVQGSDGASVGQLEVILAMGTKRQVEYFVQTKELMNRRMEIPQTPPNSGRSSESATSILSSFLENLSQQMTANRGTKAETGKPGEMRKTSDLLDILQKSLTTPPSPSPGMFNGVLANPSNTPRDLPGANNGAEKEIGFVKVSLDIERAMHLPRVAAMGEGERKSSKTPLEDPEPSVYVTFEAKMTEENRQRIVESVEGKVFVTNIIQRSSNPVWNSQFLVDIPRDLLTHPEKFFVLKVWRKGEKDSEMRPTPKSDVLLGFCTVDLKVLTAGLPEIAGCYNIVYFDGSCNGQLQLKLRPLEAIQRGDVLASGSAQSLPCAQNPMLDLGMGQDLSLSRCLKRKFTELDEITERLKARLLDVTNSELFSSDEEFEKDLNTSVDEVDEEREKVVVAVEEKEEVGDVVDAVKDDFNWLGNLTEMQKQFVEIDRKLQKNSQTLNELLDRNGFPGSSGTMYTNGGGGSGSSSSSSALPTVETLESALKDAVLNDRPNTS